MGEITLDGFDDDDLPDIGLMILVLLVSKTPMILG